MNAKRLIVESAVKDALKEAFGLQVISTETVEWVNEKTGLLVVSCAEIGRRTPGGRLMAPLIDPDGSNARPTVTLVPDAAPREDGSPRPERLCQRAKEFAALTPGQQAEHLHKLFVSAPAINDEAIALLRQVSARDSDPLADASRSIVRSAEELLPRR